MKKIDRIFVKYHDKNVGTLSLTPDNRLCVFEYTPQWIAEGFSISPLELPLKPGIFTAKPYPFSGNFGIFEDSMPDGYGRYLLHKALLKNGINSFDLSALDRLSIIGDTGMGALTYSPVARLKQEAIEQDFDKLQQIALDVLREKQDDDAGLLLFNSGNSGGARPKAIFSDNEGHWLIKFRHTYDSKEIGIQEYHYNEIAKVCGIEVSDFRLVNGKYFASRRFDISPEGQRIHMATVGALLCISLNSPVLDYSNLLALTGYLTQNEHDVEQMYRRMVFNYLTGNKDDHCKNFSFLYINNRWRLAPAYDLTYCEEGYNGEHATSVNGTGKPTLSDFVSVGVKTKMSEKRCLDIFDRIKINCADIIRD